MLDWSHIDTVLLDMDGTLLDLHFDNHFWREHVPLRYAEKHSMAVQQAKEKLEPIFYDKRGTIDWYCVDYWTETLGLDIALLKEEVDHLIAVHPYVIKFLVAARANGKRVLLVTNAHQKALALKLQRTQIGGHFDGVVCSHSYKMPKEDVRFWDAMQHDQPFDPKRSLLVDDSLPVLRSAKQYGIAHLLAVYHPDSKSSKRDVGEFDAISTFRDIIP